MKKNIILCAVAIAALSLTSCGVAMPTSNNVTETKVVLSEKNFKVVGQATGEAKATYVFGMGGIRKKALRNNAVNEMSKNANLSGAQTLTNITTQESVMMITPIFIQRTCTATANIVEFQ
ncbi:MAG: DUF6567 family protein [Bacteroidaceae bacterium]|jgi:uncharacterized secreted protein with C-terminal beta-propeller domain|nr:DUF6567 family protein [Bacteroidaceae bacterium]